MSTRDDLIAAKALIDTPEKWCKGTMQIVRSVPPYNSYCAVGACRSFAASDALTEELPEGFYMLSVYNDHPTTTHADVLALFDRAIASTSSLEKL